MNDDVIELQIDWTEIRRISYLKRDQKKLLLKNRLIRAIVCNSFVVFLGIGYKKLSKVTVAS